MSTYAKRESIALVDEEDFNTRLGSSLAVLVIADLSDSAKIVSSFVEYLT